MIIINRFGSVLQHNSSKCVVRTYWQMNGLIFNFRLIFLQNTQLHKSSANGTESAIQRHIDRVAPIGEHLVVYEKVYHQVAAPRNGTLAPLGLHLDPPRVALFGHVGAHVFLDVLERKPATLATDQNLQTVVLADVLAQLDRPGDPGHVRSRTSQLDRAPVEQL